ncbi:hypothetical protein Pr1d_44810 [Bythopirellula goksoeyrii]|uniref:DUF885 domain-containing protein n=2 Tax=Bythopirellula goksoeyrii TaxID=1400387 RepID=A0A5B9QSL9_9BACT|nr:hypothetical protein Pr1d_44810 [Bythopirellula goksoeyrii]
MILSMNRTLIPLVCLGWLAVLPFSRAEQTDQVTFDILVEDYWQYRLRESPLFATATGDRRFNDQLGEVSLADAERRNKAEQEFLNQLKAVDAQKLSTDDQINHAILVRLLNDDLAEYRFGTHLMPITQRNGFHISFPQLYRDVPLESLVDYENYLARLRAFPQYTDGHLELMRAGVASGKVLPAVVLEGWETAIDAQIVADPEHSTLFEPFKKFPTTVAESEHDRLRASARDAISTAVVPSYEKLRSFMAEEYVPRARDTIAASALPDGREFYRHRVRSFTTTDMTPDEVHQLGLAEVERIRGEMQAIIDQLEFDGDFAEFVEFLRSDPQFYATSEEQLMKEVALVLKTMDGKLPQLFAKLPRTPYGIRPVPEYIAPRTTAAYYQTPTGDGTKAGFYYVNTYDLKSRPLFNIEALSLHEAVPGHHLQLALQQEMEGMPTFRRFTDFTAFVEGWGLYSERLGLEAGFYQDPYSNFGRLTMEMWRACRLVVDTGMHYFGWTRAQAIEFLTENSALAKHDIQAEVDRYISWPGQALAYKVGELKIRELRALAEEQLGENFDVREFHNVVLSAGGVPLDVLEANVKGWLETQSTAK